MIKINEIFFSIQGESSLVGYPTVFVRTSGCNLRCHYCDTTYAYYEGKKSTIENIIEEVRKFHARHVCVTGGEPMMQPQINTLLSRLCDLNYCVSLETSGSFDCTKVDARVRLVLDVKTPDSGEGESFDSNNIRCATLGNEFKFVICSEADFIWAEDFVRRHHLAELSQVFYSPAFRQVEERWLAEKILSHRSPVRMQLQLHKYIWPPDSRGV